MDLLEALKTIRDECKKHQGCSSCPMRSRDDECCLEDAPVDWEFQEEVVVPRLFV